MISIVIPTYNRPDMLVNCIDRFIYENQGLSNKDYELIITDDSSNSETKDLIANKYPFFKYYSGPKRGPAANRNNGAAQAVGDWIMFIDDDCIPDDNIVKNYIQAIKENPGVTVFEGCIKADREKQSFLEESPVNLHGGYLWSCNFLIERPLFINTLQGFDEKFPFAAMEDVDVHVRVKKASQKIYFVKNAIVIHPWRLQSDLVTMTQKRLKSEEYFYNKHPELLIVNDRVSKLKNKLRFFYKLFKNIIIFKGKGLSQFLKAQKLIDENVKERETLKRNSVI